jgi:hypothetical protein
MRGIVLVCHLWSIYSLRQWPSKTANLTWESSRGIFHFRLWTCAALSWAMGEHSWARPKHTLSKPWACIKGLILAPLRLGYTLLVLSPRAVPFWLQPRSFRNHFWIHCRSKWWKGVEFHFPKVQNGCLITNVKLDYHVT